MPNPLPADLPENWTLNQIVSPTGTDVGLTEKHGYNYLMKQVNAAQRTVNDKATKAVPATPGNLASLAADGNPQDSGIASSLVGRVYTSLDSMGLSDANMSPTDFGANVQTLLNALPARSELKLYLVNDSGSAYYAPNLTASIQAYANMTMNSYELRLSKSLNLSIPNIGFIVPNGSGALQPLLYFTFDNALSPWVNLSTGFISKSDLDINKVGIVYTSWTALGLSDYDMSSTDFGANILKIINATPAYSIIRLYFTESTGSAYYAPNLTASAKSYLQSMNLTWEMELNRGLGGANGVNKGILVANSNGPLQPIHYFTFDNQLSPPTKIATAADLDSKVDRVVRSLSPGEDLNNVTTAGTYYVTAANASTIINAPVASALSLVVINIDTTESRIWQIASRSNPTAANGNVIWYRILNSSDGNGNWVQISTTSITVNSAAPSSPKPGDLWIW